MSQRARERSTGARELSARARDESATEEEQARYKQLRAKRSEAILQAPEEDLYAVKKLEDVEILPMARIHNSVACAGCGEPTMETRIRVRGGLELCPACFEKER